MKEIKLTQGYVALVDDEDYEKVNQYKWYAQKRHNSVHAYHSFDKTKINPIRTVVALHRFILNIKDKKIQVDHINRNGLDNRKENLRLADFKKNGANKSKQQKSKCSSKYKGVSYKPKSKNAPNPWEASIGFNNKLIYLGRFKTEKQAAEAYNKAALNYHGEFACLNEL